MTAPVDVDAAIPPGASWRALLRRRDFSAYLVARAASDFGDRLAKVAVSVAAMVSTGSVLAAAAVFAAASLPGVFADALLSPIADRRPRRVVMVTCDLLRVVVVLAMAGALSLGAPLWVALIGVFMVEVIAAPFYAAGAGLLASMLPVEADLASGNGLRWMVQLGAMSAGWVVGGVLVVAGGAELALAVDAGTFLLSAALLVAFVPAPALASSRRTSRWGSGWRTFTGDLSRAASAVRESSALRAAFGVSWASTGMMVIPGGLALALASAIGAGAAGGSWLLGAEAAGMAAGVFVVGQWPADKQQRWGPWLVVGCSAAFLASVVMPWPAVVVAWVVAGACTSFALPLANTVLVAAPAQDRGAVSGFASAGFSALQAAGFLAAGAVADRFGVRTAIACLAVSGLASAASWVRTGSRPEP